MSWIITGAEKTPVDPLFNNVSLLLHGNGVNGSTSITDNSPTPKTVTAVGNAQISTAIADPFGNSTRGVLALDGAGDYLQVADTSDLRLGSDDFTVETWVNLTVGTASVYWMSKYSIFVGGSGVVFAVLRNNHPTNPRGFFAIFGTSAAFFGSNLIADNTWHHLAFTRSSGSVRAFVDGVQAGTVFANSLNIADTAALRIGASNDSDAFANGYIDDLRITKGVARYTANFTPPTAPFPDI
jgi:hypothetical protein